MKPQLAEVRQADAPAPADPLRVLLVDDDDFTRAVISRQLTAVGATTVVPADSGGAALQVLRDRGPFEIVVCDLQMPGMDGVEFLRHLAEVQPGAAVIVISAQHRKVLQLAEELVRARGLRLLGSLPKPVQLDDLRRLLGGAAAALQAAPDGAREAVSAEDLRAAITAGEIEVYVQPKVGTRDGHLAGVEALARWFRPDGGQVLPDTFIPLAERSGLIDDLTDLVLRRALESCGEWTRGGLVTRIAVNFSPATLHRLDLPEVITRIAAACGVEPRQIIVEVTESGVPANTAGSLDVLTRLRLRGIALSIDDFGTGYSSLQQLMRLPFTELKIDRSFVASLLANPESARIVESTLGLAKDLGLQVTAEGVETKLQLQRLAQLGCDHAQGYFIARPFPRSELPDWAKHHARA